MHVIGVDLAGPAGSAATAVVTFAAEDHGLRFLRLQCDGSDGALYEHVDRLVAQGPVIVGLDAPLSYEPGGGERRRDADLRALIVQNGMRPGSVMAPTAPRMVYLTLRGIAVARALTNLAAPHPLQIVEVHPGAALCLHRAPLNTVLTFATDASARLELLSWLATQGLTGIRLPGDCSSHFVAGCAAALAAWKWHTGESQWVARAEPPWHPYDFAC